MLRPSKKRRVLHRWVIGILLATAVLAMARLTCIQGLVKPVRVVGGSMADQLYGPHFWLSCRDCGFSFRCGAHAPPRDQRVVCPNCGYAFDLEPRRDAGSPMVQGERVFIDRLAFAWRHPRRWELAALYPPDGANQLTVKRVVGLPGESVEIRDGDLYLDGRIARKTMAQLKPLAILVHDDRHRPGKDETAPEESASNETSRWRGESLQTRWRSTTAGHRFSARGSQTDVNAPPIDWLSYRHRACYRGPASLKAETFVDDHYGYNQGLTRPQLFEVNDLLVTCRIKIESASTAKPTGCGVFLQMRVRHDRWRIHLRPGERVANLFHNGKHRISKKTPAIRSGILSLEFGTWDQQVALVVNDHIVIHHSYRPSRVTDNRTINPDSTTTLRPIKIGAATGELTVADLCVFRDIYYLDPHQMAQPWRLDHRLGPREYLLLGDNVPASRDGRHWPRPANLDDLAGKVLTQ